MVQYYIVYSRSNRFYHPLYSTQRLEWGCSHFTALPPVVFGRQYLHKSDPFK